MPSQARRAIRVPQKEPLPVRRPTAPPLLAFQSRFSQMDARWQQDWWPPARAGPGSKSGSRADSLALLPTCPGSFPAQNPQRSSLGCRGRVMSRVGGTLGPFWAKGETRLRQEHAHTRRQP